MRSSPSSSAGPRSPAVDSPSPAPSSGRSSSRRLTQMILILGIAPEITLVYKAGVVAAVCLIQSPEFRAFALRAVRTDRPAPPLPPSVEQVTSSALAAPRTRRRRTRRPRRQHQPGAVMSTQRRHLGRARSAQVVGPLSAGDGDRGAAPRRHRRRRPALRQLHHRPGAGQHPDHQLAPHRPRRRVDVRDPHRRHRPLRRRRRRPVGDDRGTADGRRMAGRGGNPARAVRRLDRSVCSSG